MQIDNQVLLVGATSSRVALSSSELELADRLECETHAADRDGPPRQPTGANRLDTQIRRQKGAKWLRIQLPSPR